MTTAASLAVFAALIIVGLDRFGLLDWIKPKSASEIAAELELGDRRERRLEAKVAERDETIAQLRQQRTNEPVMEVLGRIAEQIGQNSANQAQVLDRLAAHNGSFAHMEQSLGTVAEGLKALMGTIADLHDLPMKER